MLSLYPDIEPYHTHQLVRETLSHGGAHTIYVEECGNPDGIPVIFLHGGPGSGCRPQHRCYFNPEHYRIILFDQRGCGRSTPNGELENNTLNHLIGDMEAIRAHLNIDRWILFGGSWGSTLAIAYARQYPDSVTHMILRGTFLGRREDVNWVYAEGGASKLFPEAWDALMSTLTPEGQRYPVEGLLRQLQQGQPDEIKTTALALDTWEGTIVMMRDQAYQPDPEREPGPIAHSLIQLHYALNDCFLEDQPLLESLESIKHIPTHVIHGRYDLVCPVEQSWLLQQVWPEISLEIVPLAGHAAGEPALIDALIRATNRLVESAP
jgi:proline iminopeptidase